MKLTTENFELSAARVYRKALCVSTKAFLYDLGYLDINSDLTRYKNAKDPRTLRVLINKIITACNLFGPDAIDLIVFKTKEDRKWMICQLLWNLNLYNGDFDSTAEFQKEIDEVLQ